eukprot:SAG31_NODE_47223_length_251_cov_0.684211_1_plen_53_part_10
MLPKHSLLCQRQDYIGQEAFSNLQTRLDDSVAKLQAESDRFGTRLDAGLETSL